MAGAAPTRKHALRDNAQPTINRIRGSNKGTGNTSHVLNARTSYLGREHTHLSAIAAGKPFADGT